MGHSPQGGKQSDVTEHTHKQSLEHHPSQKSLWPPRFVNTPAPLLGILQGYALHITSMNTMFMTYFSKHF